MMKPKKEVYFRCAADEKTIFSIHDGGSVYKYPNGEIVPFCPECGEGEDYWEWLEDVDIIQFANSGFEKFRVTEEEADAYFEKRGY